MRFIVLNISSVMRTYMMLLWCRFVNASKQPKSHDSLIKRILILFLLKPEHINSGEVRIELFLRTPRKNLENYV